MGPSLVTSRGAADTVPVQEHTQPGTRSEPTHVVDLSRGASESVVALVVGTDDWAVDQSCDILGARGHKALRCHDSGEPCFPCNALLPGRGCPLDQGAQVVLAVRARPLPSPAEGEMGVICALHAGLPLVTSGMATNNPFEPWATTEVAPDGDVVEASERAARRTRPVDTEPDVSKSRAVRSRR